MSAWLILSKVRGNKFHPEGGLSFDCFILGAISGIGSMKWRCFYFKNFLSSLTEVRGILFTCVSLGPHTHYIFNLYVRKEWTRKCRCALPYFSLCFYTAWTHYRISCPGGSQTFGEGAQFWRRTQVGPVCSLPPVQRAPTGCFSLAPGGLPPLSQVQEAPTTATCVNRRAPPS